MSGTGGVSRLNMGISREGGCGKVESTDELGSPRGIEDRIFESFFKTKPVGEGTGLGLEIARRIVTRRYGGDMRVDSKPGETRFGVRTPVEEKERDGG